MARGRKRRLTDDNLEGDSQVTQEQDGPPLATETSASPFTIIYKVPRKSKRASKAIKTALDVGTPAVEENVWDAGTDLLYSVRPKDVWGALKKFRNFMVAEETFTLHQCVYVNHLGIAHGEDLSDMTAKMFWVARVLEIRAIDSEHVYLRVFWFYWPEELPGGPRPYHGKNELVASNHMEIIDAMTVTGHAEVQHWREDEDEDNPSDLYWRQTWDTKTSQLSTLRKHCICEGYYNPDSMLINCSNADCKLWLHKECILKDTLSRVYSRTMGGSGGAEKSVEGTPSAKPKKTAMSSNSRAKQKIVEQDPWEGIFEAKLVNRSGRHKVLVTDLRAAESRTPSPKTTDKKSQAKTWEEDILCLGCKMEIV